MLPAPRSVQANLERHPGVLGSCPSFLPMQPCPWSRTMEKLRHGPENLTCHSERTGFYSEGVWCAATLHRPADVSSHASPSILMGYGQVCILFSMIVHFYVAYTLD